LKIKSIIDNKIEKVQGVIQLLRDYLSYVYPIQGWSLHEKFLENRNNSNSFISELKNTHSLLEIIGYKKIDFECLLKNCPAFYLEIISAIYKTSVIELFKLLEKETSGKHEQASLEYVINISSLNSEAKKLLIELVGWLRDTKLASLKEIRNKIIAHADKEYYEKINFIDLLFPLPKKEKNIDTKDIEKVFKDMWEVLFILNWIINIINQGKLNTSMDIINTSMDIIGILLTNFLIKEGEKGLNELKFLKLLSNEPKCKKCFKY
jgi:hypothetical protein